MSRIGALLLAAGGSTRLGRPKQMLELAGETLLRRATRAALGAAVDRVTVVLGAEAEACARVIADLPARTIVNPDWRQGLASSLRHGVAALRDLDAVIVLLCDQVRLTSATLDVLIDAHRRTGAEVVAARYAEVTGVPALFVAAWFDRLASLDGDGGARALIQSAGEHLVVVPFPGGEIDLDTEIEYQALR